MKRIAICLGLAFALLSCSPPPFDLGISTSAKTAKKLTLVGQVQIDPNSLNLGGTGSGGNEDVVFIPEKDGAGGITIQAGFVYSIDPTSGQQVSFIASTGGQGNYVRYGSTFFLGPVSADTYPNEILQSVKSIHNGINFQFDDVTPTNNQYTVATGNPGTSTFSSTAPITLSSLVNIPPFNPPITTGRVIGVGMRPDVSLAFDRSYWLFRQSGGNNYLEGEFDFSQNPIGPGTPLRGIVPYDISPFVGNLAKRVLYYYDPNSNRSYASVWNSPLSPGNWSTWVWVDTVPTYSQLTNIGTRIDDLLTTGELLSTQGNTANVYDPTTATGTLEATFPLGDLRFVGEVYIGGTPTVLFSEALWYGQRLTFNVYSIPTSNLKSLGN